MFADELKTLRRLGVRHVRVVHCSLAGAVLCRILNMCVCRLGLAPDPQLRLRPGLRAHDLEGLGSHHEHGITNSCCSQVRNPSVATRFRRTEEGVGSNVACSGSMEPAFYRGDLLFLTNPTDQRYQTGDITVYRVPGADIPIVHRVLETHDFTSKKKGYVHVLRSQYGHVMNDL